MLISCQPSSGHTQNIFVTTHVRRNSAGDDQGGWMGWLTTLFSSATVRLKL